MLKGLRRKFIIVAMCSVFAVLVLLIGIINAVNYVNVVGNADAIVNVLKEGGGIFGKDWLLDKPLSPETPYETRFFTVLLNVRGEAEFANVDYIAAVSKHEAAGYAEELSAKGKTSGFYGNYRYGACGTELGGTMYIFVDCTKELTSFNSFLLASVVVGVVGFALVFALVFFFSEKVMKPVADSYAKQRRFITDASHEIKTPLTIIGADAEVLEMQDGENEWTASIKNEVKRLSSLTEKLVFLARMDEDGQELNAIDFSISDAVDETVRSFEAVALSRGLTLEWNVRKNLTYCGDEAMIRQMTSLLVDNAMKYSEEGGAVSVELQPAGNKLQLTVVNTAEIKNGDLDILFERFYRSDSSRNSETGGHGIGLSVVRAIVNAHRGKISAKCEDKRVVFTVVL